MLKEATIVTALVCGLSLGTSALADPVARRQVRQQARIAQGVASGELTKVEAARLERGAARVHRQVVRDRLDGGGFTAAERAKAHATLDRQSARIARQKHDGQAR